jgi:hypothetical protein
VVVVALVAVAGAVAAGLALSSGPSGTSSPATTAPSGPTTPTTSPTTTSPTTTSTTGPPAVTAVAVVVCPTTYGVNQSTTTTVPASLEVAGVPDVLTGQLAVYTDGLGLLRVVAPVNWSCQATIGADGSGGLVVVPAGQNTTQPLAVDQQAVTAEESSSCFSCTLAQACPLFPAAAALFQSSLHQPCPGTRLAGQQVEAIRPSVMGFEDPAGVAGVGRPSGGPYPANGVVTYTPPGANGAFGSVGSYLATCTLSAAQHALCTVGLNAFVTWYGPA